MNAVKLENVGKRFMLTHQGYGANTGLLHPFASSKLAREFWALRNINIEIEEGRIVGIIGRNGAGKSTLLTILAGVAAPTAGKVGVNGRVSSLLTLGAGFQDELTGKENIFLNSSILGMSHNEINKKYRNIVEFSELDGFLDSPLQAYSQGMRMRLGFSIAIYVDFDILLLDEIFSVGDVSFQKKCFNKIEEFKKQGKTMIIATQSMEIVERFCEEAYLLENGEIAQKGAPQKVASRYMELLNEKKLSETFKQRYGELKWWADKRLWDKKEGSRDAKIVKARSYNSFGKETNRFNMGEKMTIKVDFIVGAELNEAHFGIAIFREDGVYCYGPNTLFDNYGAQKLNRGKGIFSIEYKSPILKPGKYRFSAAIWDKNELWAYDYHIGYYRFEIIGDNSDGQLINLKHKLEPEAWWQIFKIPQPEEMYFLIAAAVERQKDIVSSNIEISSFELVDTLGNAKSTFNTGEDLKIKLIFNFLSQIQDCYLWIGLFRSDDIYCHGVSKKLKMDENISLIYPNIPLLTGEYYLSVGIWGKNQQEPLFYKHKAVLFSMSFPGQDHGTIYLEHSWNVKLPESSKEG